MCRMWKFLAVLRSFFHSSQLFTFSCHPFLPNILPSSLTSHCYLFLGLPLNLVVPRFIYNTILGIIFSSTLCTCPNQHNLFNLIVSIIVGILNLHKFLYWLISSGFLFHCHILNLKFFYTLSSSKMFNAPFTTLIRIPYFGVLFTLAVRGRNFLNKLADIIFCETLLLNLPVITSRKSRTRIFNTGLF